jgi:hypothetical protein
LLFLAASLGDAGNLLTGLATTGLALGAVLGGMRGLRAFSVQTAEQRGQWLTNLQQRFTSEPAFNRVRRQLYNGDQSELVAALKHKQQLADDPSLRTTAPLTSDERQLLVDLDDFLDFFGLLEHLIEDGKLDADDAYALFSWYTLDGIEVDAVTQEITANFPWVVKLRERFEGIYNDRRDAFALDLPADPAPSNG